MVPWYRLSACKTQYIRWIDCIPRHQSWSLDIASTRVKHNTYVEFIASLGINHGTLISPQRMQNTIHTLKLLHPSASVMAPWYRLDACKTQYIRWVYGIPGHQSWYPDIASTRVKHNTHVEFIAPLGINHGTLISPQRVQNTMHTLNL